jgi:hypothetical protein
MNTKAIPVDDDGIKNQIRNAVIEECAQVAERYPGKIGGKFGGAIAKAIRALKDDVLSHERQ